MRSHNSPSQFCLPNTIHNHPYVIILIIAQSHFTIPEQFTKTIHNPMYFLDPHSSCPTTIHNHPSIILSNKKSPLTIPSFTIPMQCQSTDQNPLFISQFKIQYPWTTTFHNPLSIPNQNSQSPNISLALYFIPNQNSQLPIYYLEQCRIKFHNPQSLHDMPNHRSLSPLYIPNHSFSIIYPFPTKIYSPMSLLNHN